MFRLWGMGLLLVLLVSWLSLAAPASADTPSWSAEPIPSTVDNVLGPAGIDVRDLAVTADGATIYAVPGDSISDNIIYRSDDSGMSWVALDVAIEADLVAVAPDDANVMAIAREDAPAVYVTTSGGQTWRSLGTIKDEAGTAAAAIYDIAISASSNGVHYVAVAGKEVGGVANVWYCQTGSTTPVWKETNTLPDFSSLNVMKAVAFSPNFLSDKVIVAIGESDNVSINFEILSLSSQKWNTSAGFTDYPVTVVSDDGITDLTSASISLAPGYLGSDSVMRVAFVGLTVNGDTAAKAASGIYRLENTSQKELKTGANIHSVAFDGTNLVAGAYDSNSVYRSVNPLSAMPGVSIASPFKSPGGENKIVVAWAGSNVVAGTSGNESAFAISSNNGRSFNDISLIDTTLSKLGDVAVSADGSQVYLVTDDDTDLSLWRKTSSWARVLSRQNTTDYIVRLAPEDADVVYLAEKNAKTIYWSQDGGETGWFTRTCNVDIQDLAIESADVAYALSREGEVAKSTGAGITWEKAKSTKLDEDTGHMIVSVSEDNLLVGSTNGYVVYSTNGNSSWEKIPQMLQKGAGRVQVVADTNFATNKIIYAASDKTREDIKRWEIGTSTHWEDIFRNLVFGGVYGLVMDGSALYALEFNADSNQSTLWQCLSPTKATDVSSSWDSRETTTSTDATDSQVILNATPQALRVSCSGRLWAIKTNGTNRLYCLTDIMTRLKLMAPAPEFTNRVNPVTGIASGITFSWKRLQKATEYKLYLALDENFTQLITTITKESDQSPVFVPVGSDREGDAKVSFSAGTTYYWRVQVIQPLYSLYSETRRFSIETLKVTPPVVVEQPPPPVINIPPPPAQKIPFPEIKLPPPPPPAPEIVILPAPTPLAPITPAYVWVIIAVGAVLVLAVIVLVLITFVNCFLIWWLQKARYRWSRLRRKLCETKYLPRTLPVANSLADIEACLAQVTWTMDGPLHLFDAISYPQTVWAKKKDDCDGFAILAAMLLQRWEPSSRPVLLTAMLRPMRRSHTVCGFSVPGAGLWFFDNRALRRGHFRTYADIVTEIKGKARLVCWDVVDPDTLQTIEFHRA